MILLNVKLHQEKSVWNASLYATINQKKVFLRVSDKNKVEADLVIFKYEIECSTEKL